MRYTLFILICILLTSCKAEKQDYDLVIKNISIIDPLEEEIIPHQSIFIKDDKIIKVEESPEIKTHDSITIDGTGKYALSGLWNMHTHVTWKKDLAEKIFPLLLSYGITGVRDMGGDAGILNDFKEKLRRKPYKGPKLFGPGPIIDGSNPVHPHFSVGLTKENINSVLDSLARKNVDFLKVYSLLPEDLVQEISEYSTTSGIPFSGHISEYIEPGKAVKLGQKSIEHLNRIEDLSKDSLALKTFVQEVRKNKTWLCPTLLIYKRKVDMALGVDLSHPLYKELDPILKSEWRNAREQRKLSDEDSTKLKSIQTTFQRQKELIEYFYNNEIPIGDRK